MDYTIPDSADPVALHRWAIQLVQRLELEKQAHSASVGGGAGTSASYMPGHRMHWGGAVVPDGWLWEYGQLLEKDAYPGLYAVYGRDYSLEADPPELFRLPDTRGRMPLGTETLTPTVGGAGSFTLTLEQLPAVALDVTEIPHTHAFTGVPHAHAITDPQHTHPNIENMMVAGGTTDIAAGAVTINLGTPATLSIANAPTGVTVDASTAGGTNAEASTGLSVSLGGGGEAVEFLPPYFAGKWIVKT